MGKEDGSRIRWQDEWTPVMAACVELLRENPSLPMEDAVLAVQELVVGRKRIRKRAHIHASIHKGVHRPYLEAVQAMTDAERRALLPAVARKTATPRKPPGPRRPTEARVHDMPGPTPEIRAMRAAYKGGAHWSDDDIARLAAEMLELQKSTPYLRSEFSRLVEAQDRVFTKVTDRRAPGGLSKDWYGTGRTKKRIHEAMKRLREGAEVPPLPQPTPAAQAAAQASAPPRDDVPRVAPQVLEFATTLAYALDKLLTQQAQASEAKMQEKLAVMLADALQVVQQRTLELGERLSQVVVNGTAGLAERVSTSVTSGIQEKLGEVVHKLMEAELGPISALPVVEDPQDPRVLELAEQSRQRIAIDVLGLNGTAAAAVSDALRGRDDLDVRFIDPERGKRASFRGNVIAVTKFLAHSTTGRLQRSGANVINVGGAAQSVIAAINNLASLRNGEQPATGTH